jgi:hypothetical protein
MKTQHPSPHLLPRRRFLATASAAAAAPAFASILGRTNKSGLDPIILGSGDHQYECIHDWGQLPKALKYGNTHGVCEDAQGRIYIKHTVGAGAEIEDAIVVFDSDGKFIKSWGKDYKGGAHGLHIHTEGSEQFLYLCDPARGLAAKTSLDGEVVWQRGVPEESGLYNNAGEYHPTNVAVAPSGDVFIADGYGKSWIHRYNAKGDYLASFGGPGAERGQLACPHGLMIDTRGPEPMLIIADRSNRRLQYFTLGGHPRQIITDELRSPCHFHERNGDLLIPDLESRVTIFDKDNKLIAHLGDGQNFALRDKPREQFIPGKFIAPHGAIWDHAGNIFVVEWVEVGRVTKLRRVA